MPVSPRPAGVTAGRVCRSAARRAGGSAVVLVTLGLVLSGCGSAGSGGDADPVAADGSEPVAWVGAFCTGLGDVIAGVGEISKAAQTPQGQKDGLLAFSDTVEEAFSNTASNLKRLGPPRITDGQQVHDVAVNFFSSAAGTVGGQRDKLAELDANDPEFLEKAAHLAGPDLGAASDQMRELTDNQELMPAFGAAPECLQLRDVAGP